MLPLYIRTVHPFMMISASNRTNMRRNPMTTSTIVNIAVLFVIITNCLQAVFWLYHLKP